MHADGSDRLLGAETASKQSGFQVYTFRWITLLIFVLAGVSNAFVLLTWAPISDKAQTYWNDIDITAINLLGVVFQICYVPGTFLALHLSSKYGLRASLLSGSLLTGVGCLVRYIGALIRDDSGASASYGVVFVGTVLVALAQPVYLNMPAKIASVWFAVSERDTAAVLGSLSNPLGSAIGSFIPGMLVTGDSFHQISGGIRNTLLVQFIVSMVSLGTVTLLFREGPPTPPCVTAERRVDPDEESTLFTHFGDLLTSPEYVKLLIPFTIILANLNAVATLLNQLPVDYSSGEIGVTGAALIMGGFLASIGVGYLLDCTKSYKTILISFYVLTFAAWVFFMASCQNNMFPMFIVAAVCLGATTLPSVSVTMVLSVEVSYPIPADAAVGLLYMFANTVAIAMTFIGQVLLSEPKNAPAPFFPYGIFIIILFGMAVVPILLFRGKFQRMLLEH